MVDIESDGPIPGDFSMISAACCTMLSKTPTGRLKPSNRMAISNLCSPTLLPKSHYKLSPD
jgi:hypothetical protein